MRPSRRHVVTTGAALAGAASFSRRASGQARLEQGELPRGRFVIEGGAVLAFENGRHRLKRDASVVVEDNRIAEVRDGPVTGNIDRITAPTMLILPGFISGHTHVALGTPTRGLIEGPRRANPRRPQTMVEDLDDDDLDAVTAFNLMELIRSGCTTQIEMSLSLRQAESYVRVAEKWGARGYPGGMIPGNLRLTEIWYRTDDEVLTQSVPGTLEDIADNLAFGKAHMGAADGRILPMMSPHATDTHTEETMRAVIAAAQELGTGMHIHLSQSQEETDRVKRLWGATPTQWLDSLGAFDLPCFGAHMTALDWATDPEILARKGVVYATCPTAGGANGFTQPYPEARAAGMAVNIGIDTHANDYVTALKLAVIKGQARFFANRAAGATRPQAYPRIADAIDAATLVPADALNRPDLGRIEQGAKADLVAIDVGGPFAGAGAVPPEPLNNLLYASGHHVRHVMTDGVLQVFDGAFVADDEAAVAADSARVMRALWKTLERENWFAGTL